MRLRVLTPVLLSLLLYSLGGPVVRAAGPTYVQGFIGSDTTWSPSGSPYIVIGNVTVGLGATLTMTAGTSVLFNAGKALFIGGRLLAQGAANSPVIFDSNASAREAGDWDGVKAQSGGLVSLTNCRILNFTIAVTLSSGGNTIQFCIISHGTAAGVAIGSNGNRIEGSDISDSGVGVSLVGAQGNALLGNNLTNNGVGISHFFSSGNTIRNNSLLGNADLAIQTDGSVDLQYNYFGTTDVRAIERATYWPPYVNVANPLSYRDSGAVYENGTTVWSNPQSRDKGVIVNGDLTIQTQVSLSNMFGSNYIQVNGRMRATGASFSSQKGYFSLLYLNKSTGAVDSTRSRGMRGLGLDSDTVMVTNSTLEDGLYGALVRGTSGSNLRGLRVANNTWSGIQISGATSARIEGSRLLNNSLAVSVGGNRHVIEGNWIEGNFNGVDVGGTGSLVENNLLIGNRNYAVRVGSGKFVTINQNVFEANRIGVFLLNADGTNVSENTIANSSQYGAYVARGSWNVIYHNDFLWNVVQSLDDDTGNNNRWFQWYPVGGNYWSNYTGFDNFQGPLQNVPGADGFGDTPHWVDNNTRDVYPLMKKPSPTDYQPPVIETALINGLPTYSISFGTPNILLTARANDTLTGGSQIGGANYTFSPSGWPSNPMRPTTPLAPVRDFETTVDTSFLAMGSHDFCVYAWDVAGNSNLTGRCAVLNVSTERMEPRVLNARLDGSSFLSLPLSSAPNSLSLTAILDDTFRGYSNISGANFTSEPANWSSAAAMNAADGAFDSPNETVVATVSTPSTQGIHSYCVYGADQWGNKNTTGLCAKVEILDDLPPKVFSVEIDGLPGVTYNLSQLPSFVNLTAIIDDSPSGESTILAANTTLGIGNWSSSRAMLPTDGTFDSANESVQMQIATPASVGIYLYCVYGTDSGLNGGTENRCAPLTIVPDGSPGNKPPVPFITVTPSTAGHRLDVFGFDGTRSYDPDGSVVSWEWDFGDGRLAAGPLANHAFTAKGLFTVTLRVTDDKWATNVTNVTVFILNRAPTANAGPSQTVPIGSIATLDGSSSSDLDGDLLTYKWTQIGGPLVGLTGANDAIATFMPGLGGVYAFLLTVDDGDGGVDSSATIVTALPHGNSQPVAVASVSPSEGNLSTVFLFNGTASSDSDGTISSWRWDFGDGDVAFGAVVTHSFATRETFTVSLTVTDDGGATGVDTVMVKVKNRAPVISSSFPSTPFSIQNGQTRTLGIAASDPDNDILSYTWRVDGEIVAADLPFLDFMRDTSDNHVVNVTVSDGSLNNSYEWVITVNSGGGQQEFPWWLVALGMVLVCIGGFLIGILLGRKREKEPEETQGGNQEKEPESPAESK